MAAVTARQKVYGFIQRRKGATSSQIAQGLSMSGATVRHHLAILTAQGRIVAEDRPAGTRKAKGRPERRYRLSERMLGDNLGNLAEALLSGWLDGLPEAERREAMLRIASAIHENAISGFGEDSKVDRRDADSLFQAAGGSGKSTAAAQKPGASEGQLTLAGGGVGTATQKLSATQRVVRLTDRLTELAYAASWEAGAEGPRILFGHCPYAAIIAKHPELCSMDAQVLSLEMGLPVQQVQ